MRNLLKLFALTFCFFAFNVHAITIKKVDLKKMGSKGRVTITYDGLLKAYPELDVKDNSVLIQIPDSKINGSVSRAYKFASKSTKDTKLEATQRSKSTTSVKTILPYSAQKLKDKVTLMIKDQTIELNFPHMYVKKAKNMEAVAPKKVVKKEKKSYLNESYLAELIKEETNETAKLAPKTIKPKNIDTIKLKQAKSQEVNNTGNSSISFIEYAGKFVAFLGVVLVLFWGVIALMKKGFIKKGKLGFLNKTDQIQVLSQTFIAPKKSLMMIKAHDQVFLVSNTEAGIHPISEMNNPAGILKAGEKAISGTNFDESVNVANEDTLLENKIKLKKDITKSNKESSLSDYLGVKDQVKFSDQIKKKVKGLKPLQ